jgi:stage III sporulation protein AA
MLACRNIHDILREDIFPCLPSHLMRLLERLPSSVTHPLTEIRMREGKPLILQIGLGELFVAGDGTITPHWEQAYVVTRADIQNTLNCLSQHSLYAMEEELRNGYITLRGGHRAGLTGQAVLAGGHIRTLKYISSINLRIARELLGVANGVLPYLVKDGSVYNTLIISPPQCGKTTLLRDIARQLSNGVPQLGLTGLKIGIVDERSEIAGCYEGIPQNDVGMRTDVLDACPKAEGMLMLIRSMSPQVIIGDEIGRHEDIYAMREAVQAGVNLVATVHGGSLEQLMRRPSMAEIIASGTFERYVILGKSRGIGTIEAILDADKQNVLPHPVRKEIRSCG